MPLILKSLIIYPPPSKYPLNGFSNEPIMLNSLLANLILLDNLKYVLSYELPLFTCSAK